MDVNDSVTIRRCNEGDYKGLILLADDFFRESHWCQMGFEYDQAQAGRAIELMAQGHLPTIVADIEGDIIGCASWAYDQVCTTQPIAMGFVFYVHPDMRRTSIGVRLIDAAIDQARHDGACGVYFSSTAGFDDNGRNEKLFSNMMQRKGFKSIGRCFMRNLKE